MRISQEADYAFRIIHYLSNMTGEDKNDAKSIAETLNIPHRFAVKILRKLSLGGFVKAKRGAKGGYGLNMPSNEITFLKVVECIDGPLYINKCLKDVSLCSDNRNGACYVHEKLQEVNKTVKDMLSKITFEN